MLGPGQICEHPGLPQVRWVSVLLTDTWWSRHFIFMQPQGPMLMWASVRPVTAVARTIVGSSRLCTDTHTNNHRREFIWTFIFCCPHLLNCLSESSVTAAAAANTTCWMDRINWSRRCQHTRQIRAADCPIFLMADCSVPVSLKFTFHKPGRPKERAKWNLSNQFLYLGQKWRRLKDTSQVVEMRRRRRRINPNFFCG